MTPLILSIGIAYLLALGAGRLCAAFGLPRVTGYPVAGFAAGPAVGGLGLPALITRQQLHKLVPLHDVILGLILFTIGGCFSLSAVRKMGMRHFRISSVEIGLTGFLVATGAATAGASPMRCSTPTFATWLSPVISPPACA